MVLYGPGHQVLRVLVPAYLDLRNSVPTPDPNTLPSAEGGDLGAVGDDGGGLSDDEYEGGTELFCAGIGKLAGEVVGVGVSIGCGIAADTSDQPFDGFEITRILACAAVGLIPFVGIGAGPACDIGSSDEPAY